MENSELTNGLQGEYRSWEAFLDQIGPRQPQVYRHDWLHVQ
jgi:hypothetical protein